MRAAVIILNCLTIALTVFVTPVTLYMGLWSLLGPAYGHSEETVYGGLLVLTPIVVTTASVVFSMRALRRGSSAAPFIAGLPLILALVAALLFAAGQAYAASFDCAKASTAVEKTVCADKALDARDSLMGKLYDAALHGERATEFRERQGPWLATLQVCSAAACLRQRYDAQIARLLDSPGAHAAGASFASREADGNTGEMTLFGPVDGLSAVSISSTFVGPGGAAKGDVNADGVQGIVALDEGHGRFSADQCVIDLVRIDAATWKVTQSGTCSFADGVSMVGIYRR